VHVRWQASVDASERQRLEARLRLADGERLAGSTWRYDLVDPSPNAIRALVLDPAVEDTHYIDRSRFALDGAGRTTRRGSIAYADALVTAADGVAIAVAAFAAFVMLSHAAFTRCLWSRVRGLLFRSEELLFRTENRLFRSRHRLLPYASLAVLGVAVYAVALRFPPTNGDDMNYLSSVAATSNPLVFFFQDAGAGGLVYRPLLRVGMWLTYQGFGVWALPNQIINLALHMANVLLLYGIVRRAQPDGTLAWLFAAVFMVSQYTFSAATWTSDRPMVLTGLFLLLLVNHLSRHNGRSSGTAAARVRVSLVALFSVLALMSKESGLVVPTVSLLFALVPGVSAHLTPRNRFGVAAVSASMIGLYMVFRVLVFGTDFAAYSQDGYMFLGLLHYEDSADLPRLLLYLNYAENVAKNALAPVLPVFDETGSLLPRLSAYWIVIASTALLSGLAVRRHLTGLQWIAVMISLASAVTHYALFRFRLHYLSHAAFCLFAASSPSWGNGQGYDRKALAAKTLAVVVLAGSMLWTTNKLDEQMLARIAALSTLEEVERHGDIVEQVLLRYR
jgi:hypothetical protein